MRPLPPNGCFGMPILQNCATVIDQRREGVVRGGGVTLDL